MSVELLPRDLLNVLRLKTRKSNTSKKHYQKLRLLVFGVAIVLVAAVEAARAQDLPQELLVRGFSWDVQIEAGVGFGLKHELAYPWMGRIRLGALYAYEPWIFNLGAAGELGGLGSRSIGAELEINHFGGPWTQIGLSYARERDWIGRFSLGFALFSLEWQHCIIGDHNPENALFFVVRAPIGIGCFLASHL